MKIVSGKYNLLSRSVPATLINIHMRFSMNTSQGEGTKKNWENNFN